MKDIPNKVGNVWLFGDTWDQENNAKKERA